MTAHETFDVKCYELACDFLDDSSAKLTEANCRRLAIAIQQAIEDEIRDMEAETDGR